MRPGKSVSAGKRSGPWNWNASKNAANASSSNDVHFARCAVPLVGSLASAVVHAPSAIWVPSDGSGARIVPRVWLL